MSGYSASTAPTTQGGRDSQQWGLEGKAGVKIVEADESVRDDGSEIGGNGGMGMEREGEREGEDVRGKGSMSRGLEARAVGGRVVL